MEELHDQTVEAPVVDVGQAGDQVVLGITEPVQHKPLSLEGSLVEGPLPVELEGHGRSIEDGDPAIDDTAAAVAHLEQQESNTPRCLLFPLEGVIPQD